MIRKSWSKKTDQKRISRSRRSKPRSLFFRPYLERLEIRETPAMLTVTTTADTGAGSLRAALTNARRLLQRTAAVQQRIEGSFARVGRSFAIHLGTRRLRVRRPIAALRDCGQRPFEGCAMLFEQRVRHGHLGCSSIANFSTARTS